LLTLIDRIGALKDVSATEARLTRYLSHAYSDVPFLSAAEIARRAGVSPATVSRFIRKLGYDDHGALKHNLQVELYSVATSPAERFKVRGELPALETVLDSYVRQVTHNVEVTLASLNLDELEQLCLDLLQAQRVFIMAQRVSFGPGWNLALTLGQLLPDVRAVEGARATLADEFSAFRSNDYVLILALTRIGTDIRHAVEYLQRRGVPYGVVTNLSSESARSMFQGAQTLFVRTQGVTAFGDMVPLLALTQLVTIAVERVAPTAHTCLTDGEVAYKAFATFEEAEEGGAM